jgi:acetyl-CoA carboxylase carboxyl transferase subunit beta
VCRLSKIRDIFRSKPKYVTVKPGTARQSEEKAKGKAQVPDGLWTKCPHCNAFIYRKDLERNLGVCEKCMYHFPIGAWERIRQLTDTAPAFVEFDADLAPADPLQFPEYQAKIERDSKKTGLADAIVTGKAIIGGYSVVCGVMDFGFMGGSMGSVVGEKVTRAFERAIAEQLPVVLVSSSGGARMQEAILSLMQMQKTAAAVERHNQAGLLYISVLANPTTAGVYGSFASQGDINLAEPGATVGFAGRPVIEAATGKRVPPDLQKAETVFENGFIDIVVPRPHLKSLLTRLLAFHGAPMEKPAAPAEEPATPADAPSTADNAVSGDHGIILPSEEPVGVEAAPLPQPRRGLRRRRHS